ncbi:MAG: hypothetical protein ACO3RU_13060, partial [Planctomycetota bacterium]
MTIPNLNPDYEALLREMAAQVPSDDAMDVEMDDVDYGEGEDEQDIPGAAEPYGAASSGTTTIVLDANGQRANEEMAPN